MLMLKTTHDRIVADDAKKLGENAELIAKLIRERDECKSTAAKVFAANLKLASKLRMSEHRYDRLEAKHAVFTGPRPRDAKGHFLSTKGAQA